MSASGRRVLPGVAAIALFVVMVAVILGAEFGTGTGFPGSIGITTGIGYLLFDLTGQTQLGEEGFLAAFEIIDVVLVAALVGAVMLARKEPSGEPLRADGGDDEGGEA
jgi:NADH-quinone oxidoreductase subunit J